MSYNLDIHHQSNFTKATMDRKSIRLKDYDYLQNDTYLKKMKNIEVKSSLIDNIKCYDWFFCTKKLSKKN